MRFIKPSFEIWEQSAGLEGVYKQIERVGRVCYKSEDKITKDSAKSFVDRMIKSGHGAMLEHGTVYLGSISEFREPMKENKVLEKYKSNPYSRYNIKRIVDNKGYVMRDEYVTTNMRVLVENNWLDDLEYICGPTERHEKRVAVHFVCDRGVSHKKFVA